MGGRLPLTMRVASIGSWGSAGTPQTRAVGTPNFSKLGHCRERLPRAIASRPARRRNFFSAKALAAAAIPVGGFAQIAARRMNLSEGQRD